MKIAFIAPAVKFISEHAPLNELLSAEISRGYRWPEFNLTLLTLAGMTPPDCEITLIDEVYKDIDFEKKYDIVAITAMTFSAKRAYEIARRFREKGIYTALGGIHATLLPGEAAAHVDTVFIGEAETSWPQFLRDFADGAPKKLYYGSQPEMSDSPVPRWDLLGDLISEMPPERLSGVSSWTVGVNATRGCPRDCEYCSSTKVYGAKFRTKSIDHVRAEVREIKKWTAFNGISNFTVAFRDDNPILSEKYGFELAHAMQEENVYWTALTDIAIYKRPELIRALYPSGCLALGLGLESLNESSLQSIAPWKSTQISHYEEFVRFAVEEGLMVGVNFILGMDSDTEASLHAIDKFCSRYPIAPNFLILTPFPNQPITRRLKAEGRLAEGDYWDRCNLFNLVFEPKLMTKLEVYEQLTYLHRKFNSPFHWQSVRDELQNRRKKRGYQALPAMAQSQYEPQSHQSFTP